jgi:hypothetical protein
MTHDSYWLEADLEAFRNFVDHANTNSANPVEDILVCKLNRDEKEGIRNSQQTW